MTTALATPLPTEETARREATGGGLRPAHR